jgi:hypothetical protein
VFEAVAVAVAGGRSEDGPDKIRISLIAGCRGPEPAFSTVFGGPHPVR